jgi:hypothetical protein
VNPHRRHSQFCTFTNLDVPACMTYYILSDLLLIKSLLIILTIQKENLVTVRKPGQLVPICQVDLPATWCTPDANAPHATRQRQRRYSPSSKLDIITSCTPRNQASSSFFLQDLQSQKRTKAKYSRIASSLRIHELIQWSG